MFHLEPISTTNIISVAQLVAVIAGFYFSWSALNATRKNNQVQLYNDMLIQGRELQLKFMDDLVAADSKTEFFMGIIIGYYASCFELRGVLSLPTSAVKLLEHDVRESMRDPVFRHRFDELRNLHSREFGQFVDSLRGVS